jgi:putative PIN family toxin of toxin-antitoxin system
MLRVVLDTNIFVSSLLVKEGIPAQVLDAWRDRQYALFISPTIISEIRSTLDYPHIRNKYNITDGDIDRLITLLEYDAFIVPGDNKSVAGSIPEDPPDEAVLACALDARADLIVSGDRHLLELKEYKGIPIHTVRDFLESLKAEDHT